MEVSALSGLVTNDAATKVQEQVQVQALRKATNIEAQSAAQLVAAVPAPQTVEPGQPGAVVNTYA